MKEHNGGMALLARSAHVVMKTSNSIIKYIVNTINLGIELQWSIEIQLVVDYCIG